MSRYVVDVMEKIVKSVSQAGTVKLVDMDRVSVIPDGSSSALRGVVFSGDSSKVKPGDRVSLIKYQGRYVAFKQGDVPTSDQAAVSTTQQAKYATFEHRHDGIYAPVNHTHDGAEYVKVVRNQTFNIKADGTGDFTSLQDAMSKLKGITADQVTLKLAAGTYSEWAVVQGIMASVETDFVIKGDLRAAAGFTYVCGDGTHLLPNIHGGALGNITITRSGNAYTIAGSGSSPDIGADGWVNGDKVIISTGGGVPAIFTISSVAANMITFTTTPPAPGYGTTVTLCPNVKLTNPSNAITAVVTANMPCTLQGIWIDHSYAAGTGLYVTMPRCTATNMLWTTNAGVGLRVDNGGIYYGYWGSSIGMVATKSSYGLYANGCVSATMNNLAAINCQYGVICDHGSAIANTCMMVGCNYSYLSTNRGVLSGVGYIVLSTIGYNSQWQSMLNAIGAVGKNWAVTTTYSPATSGTVGNNNAIIQYS